MASLLTQRTEEFAADVAKGLLCTPRRIPSKYLYDALGSRLFEAICELPWYPITRTELSLIERHGRDMARALGGQPTLVELGCGAGDKIAALASKSVVDEPAHVHLIDISATALDLSEKTLSVLPGLDVKTHRATYQEGVRGIARNRPGNGPLLLLFLGSNVGNFPSNTGIELLSSISQALKPGDGMLLGTDLVKSEPQMQLAYRDPLGVTSAFNLNLLQRANRELGANFDLAAFEHVAEFNAPLERMESYLVSRREQKVEIPLSGVSIDFHAGDRIWTETSQKYSLRSIAALATESGFQCGQQWVDADSNFAVTLLRPFPRATKSPSFDPTVGVT